MEEIVAEWISSFHDHVLEYNTETDVQNDEEIFGNAYHSLIHSSVSNTLLRIEHGHVQSLENKILEKEQKLKDFDAKEKDQETDNFKSWNSENGSDWKMTQREKRELLEMESDSSISFIIDTQFREFRDWVTRVYAEMKSETFSISSKDSSFSIEAISKDCLLQESLTITLGGNSVYNLRLIARSSDELCQYSSFVEDSLPQRLQTSMSLYSINLSGLVLPSFSTSVMNDSFNRLCSRSMEFHFPTYEQQFERIHNGEWKKEALTWRRNYQRQKLLSEKRREELPFEDHHRNNNEEEEKREEKEDLMTGDFYITRHSNLCETHVIFHLMTDKSILSNNINSRHPFIMGLRNVLKTASLNDITTITLPLLLTLELDEIMTIQWCLKRAELVFKCVKGFMMEVASWGGSEIKTLQFLLPSDIDPDVFNRIVAMLSSIFRTSNPIRVE